jgi:transposase
MLSRRARDRETWSRSRRTTGADQIVAVLERHAIRVVVADRRKLRSITEAKAKTDRLDARTLARLFSIGLLDEVWTPDERTRALRRLTNREGCQNDVHSGGGSVVLVHEAAEKPSLSSSPAIR